LLPFDINQFFMASAQEIPWKRLSAEVVAIVFGILLAFAIDAWWQNRTDIGIETQYLHALREDLIASLELLDEAEASQQLQIEYLKSLLLTDGNTPDSDEARLWLEDGLFEIGTYRPQLSSLSDLESSGQSRIIRDPAIRQALASVSQMLELLAIGQSDFVESQQSLIDPFLVEHLDLASVLRVSDANIKMDLSILGTKEFRSRVAFKLNLRDIVANTQQEIRTAFLDALALIEMRLERID